MNLSRLAILRLPVLLAAPLLLAGCISFGEDPPPALLTLTPEAPVSSGSGVTAEATSALTVMRPQVPGSLGVTRVPVQVDAATIAYLKDAIWVERPARQFRRLLAETIRARSNRVVVEGSDYEVAGTPVVSGRLTQMGYDAQSQSVVVRFDGQILEETGAVRTRRFESVVSGVQADAAMVAPAMNRAANAVAKEVAEWLLAGK